MRMGKRSGGGSKKSKFVAESNLHEPGTHEYSFAHLYPTAKTSSAAQKANIQSPKLSFKTDTAPLKTFRLVLETFRRGHFSWAIMYDGPELGLSDETPEMVDMEKVVDALAQKKEEVLPFGGLKAVLVYDTDQKVRARVSIKGGSATKVKVKVRGAVSKTDWNLIKNRINKRFHVQV
jgi:hypothetical protein